MDDAASAASLNLNDTEYIEFMKCASQWFNEYREMITVPDDNSDISTERTLSDNDDGRMYRNEQPPASFLSGDSRAEPTPGEKSFVLNEQED
jgi:hypothetical protein